MTSYGRSDVSNQWQPNCLFSDIFSRNNENISAQLSLREGESIAHSSFPSERARNNTVLVENIGLQN